MKPRSVAAAEFYVNPWLTVGAQGGGIEGDFPAAAMSAAR